MTRNAQGPLAGADRSAEERGENEGMPEPPRKPSGRGTRDAERGGSGERPRSRRSLSAENTDLERRVLAHERILQSLIAHMAETEPEFISRLHATFGDPTHTPRQEYDYTDTDAYAEQFIRGVARLGEKSAGPGAPAPEGRKSRGRLPKSVPVVAVNPAPPTAFRVMIRLGVWQVTKDGSFYGDFLDQAQADKAVNAAIMAIARAGGSARIARPEPVVADG